MKSRHFINFILGALWVVFATSRLFADTPPQERLPFLDVQKIALTAVPGKVTSASLENTSAGWAYVFLVRDNKRVLHLVTIDAITGKLTGNLKQNRKH